MPTISNEDHLPRLTLALHALLCRQRVASLGTTNQDGTPFVSMVPFALDPLGGVVVVHVSGLAPHSGNMQRSPAVSLLVMDCEVPGAPVHALPRVSLDGKAESLQPDSPAWEGARTAYLARFPEAEPMTRLGDFRFVAIELSGARQVAGFGAARAVDAITLMQLLKKPAPPGL